MSFVPPLCEAPQEGDPPVEEPLIDIAASPVADVLDVLLQDKTTKKNIIWATDAYAEYGEAFADTAPMDAAALLRRPGIIRPRIRKTQEEQARRTRTKAEVYTPAWLCNRMNNDCDADWFGRPGVFNAENAGAWTPAEGTIQFPPKKIGDATSTRAALRSPAAKRPTSHRATTHRRASHCSRPSGASVSWTGNCAP